MSIFVTPIMQIVARSRAMAAARSIGPFELVDAAMMTLSTPRPNVSARAISAALSSPESIKDFNRVPGMVRSATSNPMTSQP